MALSYDDIPLEIIVNMFALHKTRAEIEAFFRPYLNADWPNSMCVLDKIQEAETTYLKHPVTPAIERGSKIRLSLEQRLEWRNADTFKVINEYAFEPLNIHDNINWPLLVDTFVKKAHEGPETSVPVKRFASMRLSIQLGHQPDIFGFIDLSNFVDAGHEEGVYHFANCNCGVPGCGISYAVVSLHKHQDVYLLLEGYGESTIFQIDKAEYLAQATKLREEVLTLTTGLKQTDTHALDISLNWSNRPTFNTTRSTYLENTKR